MADPGWTVVCFHDAQQWRCEPLPASLLDDLDGLIGALRAQAPDRGPFVVASVDDEFFVVARLNAGRIDLLLSDLTAAVDYDLAAQVLERLGEDPPEEDELDEVWPLGDLDLFDDLGLGEEELEAVLDDLDAYADEMLATVAERLGIGEAFATAARAAGAGAAPLAGR